MCRCMVFLLDVSFVSDRNEDNLITEEEFAMLPPGEVDGANMAGDQEWVIERKKEFKDVIDLNNDGFVDEAELKVIFNKNNKNIRLLIPTDKYTVRLHDIVVTDDNKFNKSRFNCMAALQGTHLSYCPFS